MDATRCVIDSIFRLSDERAGLIWGSKISQNPQPPGRPKKLPREFWAGVSEGFGVLCVLARYKDPWKIVLKGGQGLGSRACWDKGSMCEPLVSSLQPSSGRLKFGETRGGYPCFT